MMETTIAATMNWGLPNICIEFASESQMQALNIRHKLLGESHESTACSYHELGLTHCLHRDYTSGAESHMQAPNIRQKVLG